MRYAIIFLAALAVLLPVACGKTDNVQGHSLYDQHCANCHMEEGTGLRQLIPPLAGADFLREQPEAVVKAIRNGMDHPIVVNGIDYHHPMPGNDELTEFQIVNIVNYINQAWGNDYGRITVMETREWLQE